MTDTTPDSRDDALVGYLTDLEQQGHTLTADDVKTALDGGEIQPRVPPKTDADIVGHGVKQFMERNR